MNNIKKVSGCVTVTMEKGVLSLEGLQVDTNISNGIILDEIRLYAKEHKKELNNKITIFTFDIVKAKTSKEEPEEYMFWIVDKYLIKKI